MLGVHQSRFLHQGGSSSYDEIINILMIRDQVMLYNFLFVVPNHCVLILMT